MASFGKFQNDNNKYTRKESRIDKNNPSFNSAVKINGEFEKTSFEKNLKKWSDVVSYFRWFPDAFWDVLTPKTGSIRLDLDQRVFLRALARFPTGYYVFSRAYGKTLLEVMGLFHTCIFYPRIKVTLTAQSLKKAASILKAKYNDLINFYPLLKEEIYSANFRNDHAVIEFHNGSIVDILPNSQTAKGERRHRGSIEEDNLVEEGVYNDAVRPVFDDPRRTIGKNGKIDPNENNSSVNSFTTSGYRGSPAYKRCVKAFNEMIDLQGSMCLGASWKLPAFNGRGKDINEILKDKKTQSPFLFDMNYMSHWTGSGDEGICNVAKLMECRNLENPNLSKSETSRVILSVDVAQSDKDGNCQTIVTVFETLFLKTGRVKEVRIPQIYSISGKLNYTAQSINVKRVKNKYNAEIIVVDNNGLGRGLTQELLKEQIDPLTGESLGCYDTINTEDLSEVSNSPKVVFCYLAQTYDQESIPVLMECIETCKVRLLAMKDYGDFDITDDLKLKEIMLPFIQTNFLIDEIQNIILKILPNGKLSIAQATTRLGKDRFSSLLYGLWYIMKHFDIADIQDTTSDLEYLSRYISW